MNNFAQRNRLVATLVTICTSIVYLSTLAPTVAFWDCGEFITTSYIFGVPHPPGAPLYTLLGRLFSMLPFGEIAFRVNLLSAASGIATVLLIYLCTVRLLANWLDRSNTQHQIAIFTGAAVAALSTAFSFSFWNNAIEAEVYGLSMCITLLAVWLGLRWDNAHKDHHSDRNLLFIAYLFGLGAGIHLQCLLTIPGILILIFTDLLEDRPRKTQVLIVIGLIFYPFLSIVLPQLAAVLMTGAIVIGLLSLRPAWRNPQFWIWAIILGALGFSTYITLYLRSGLNPIIDMNDPETWENFKAFIGRTQYGTHFLFPRRAEPWSYQINIHIKYFLQQFPFIDGVPIDFRRAVDVFNNNYETIQASLITTALGIGGAVYHFKKDWQRFSSIFSMFAIMGLGLVLYLNMPDPEPREREYIFVGAYTFFGIWMGIGAAGLVVWVQNNIKPIAMVAPFILLLVPTGILVQNYHVHNRTGDFVAFDYAYNIMQTCEENAILFTNGDNDTYPLWFLQGVENIRTDIQIVNLSLIKTNWYVKQIRDAGVPLDLSDTWIDNNMLAQPWDKDKGMSLPGIQLTAQDIPKAEYFLGDGPQTITVVEPQTWMMWRIIQQNNWKRPIYFAVTVPNSNMAGLRPFLSMEGMAYKLVKERGLGQFNTQLTTENLLEKYRYTGVADSTINKDPVARRLLSNYLVIFAGLTQAYMQLGLPQDAFQVLTELEKRLPPHALDQPEAWHHASQHYRDLAIQFAEAGEIDLALASLENLLRLGPKIQNPEEIRNVIERWRNEKNKLMDDSVTVPNE
ncbi:MAG: hypothetical protein ACI8V2_004549 [Candidatus Latescibacterota bacterium]|jgi:hypothetical protein